MCFRAVSVQRRLGTFQPHACQLPSGEMRARTLTCCLDAQRAWSVVKVRVPRPDTTSIADVGALYVVTVRVQVTVRLAVPTSQHQSYSAISAINAGEDVLYFVPRPAEPAPPPIFSPPHLYNRHSDDINSESGIGRDRGRTTSVQRPTEDVQSSKKSEPPALRYICG